jgi:23S rRNA (pseudouridine1915-N3)-methyltransferase
MKIVLLQTGKTTERYLKEGLSIYEERIRRYLPFEIVSLPEIRLTRNMPEEESGR